MTCLEVHALTKRFGGLVANDDVSFEVPERGIFAVIGPNGAGKTTLFSMISGALPPTSGRVVFKGVDITGAPPEAAAARGLVRTFQLVQPFADLSVAENVKIGRHVRTRGTLLAALLRPRWARRQEADTDCRTAELLDFVGLAGQADALAGSLPYGQQRLLEIARALAAEPALLLLDEPAAGLNHAETERLSTILHAIAARGTTILLIEHDMKLIMNTASRIVVLNFGRKIAEGTPDEIRTAPAVLEAYLGGVESADA